MADTSVVGLLDIISSRTDNIYSSLVKHGVWVSWGSGCLRRDKTLWLVTHGSSVISQAKVSVLSPSFMLLSIRPQYFLIQEQDHQNLAGSFQGKKK